MSILVRTLRKSNGKWSFITTSNQVVKASKLFSKITKKKIVINHLQSGVSNTLYSVYII